jgi:hypothetical protein|tara:strand:+ start:334 stop:1173 length:840 start_codon:yes stop_codon:yes gene_type:complete
MFQINWKLKSFLFKILSFFKLYKLLFFIQKKITKRSNINLKKIIFYWDYHLKYLRENNSNSLLEIGAGKSLSQNIYLSYKFNKQIEQTLIDVSKMLDLDLFNQANEQISNLLNVNKLPYAKSIKDLKENYNINYLAPMSLKKLKEQELKFDACISSTTLEHLSTKDLEECFDILKKIIKKNGIISAAIDYSDHYSHTDNNIENLNFLQFNDKEWDKFNTPMLFQNRLRHQDYRKIFENYKFKIFEIPGNYGKCPERISNKFDIDNKETFMLWGYFLLKL